MHFNQVLVQDWPDWVTQYRHISPSFLSNKSDHTSLNEIIISLVTQLEKFFSRKKKCIFWETKHILANSSYETNPDE